MKTYYEFCTKIKTELKPVMDGFDGVMAAVKQEFRNIYDEAAKRLDGDTEPLDYGPAHIVWDDDNYDSAEYCLQTFDEMQYKYTPEQLAVVRWSLQELAKIPIGIREAYLLLMDVKMNIINIESLIEMMEYAIYVDKI